MRSIILIASICLCLLASGQIYDDLNWENSIWKPFLPYISSAQTGHSQNEILRQVLPMTNDSYFGFGKADIRRRVGAHLIVGKIFREHGEYQEAFDFLSQGIALIEGSDDISSFAVAYKSDLANDLCSFTFFDIYDEMGQLYLDLGRLDEAEERFRQSLEMRRTHFSKKHGLISRPYLGLGRLSRMRNQQSEALDFFMEAEKILLSSTATSVSPRLLYAELYYELAKSYIELKDYKKGIRKAKSALGYTTLLTYQALQTYKTGDYLQKSRIENLISQAYLLSGDQPNAEKWIQKADETYREHFSTALNQYSEIIKTYSKIYWAKSDFAIAHKFLELMMDNNIHHIQSNFAALNQKEKQDFYKKISEDLNLYFDLSFQLYAKGNDPALLRSIMNRRISTKGFLLNDEVKIRAFVNASSDTTLQQRFKELQALREKLAHEAFTNTNTFQLGTLQTEIETLEKSISAEANYDLAVKNQTIEELCGFLGEGENAIEVIRYTRDEQIVYAFVSFDRSQEFKSNEIYFEASQESKLASLYSNSMKFGLSTRSLYEELWGPLHSGLKDKNQVVVSPDGIYNQINIGSLQIDNDTFVADDLFVKLVTNFRDISRVKSNQPLSQTSVLFGQPNYAQSASDPTIQPIDGLSRASFNMQLSNFQEQTFADLPGTREEVLTIAKTLKEEDWQVTYSLDQDATESQVKRSENPGLLHIATHGFFLDNSSNINPMIKSGLVMAGVNDKGNQVDDGILTAYEAAGLRLDKTWMVVLSACETGLGEVRNGEGVYGLQRAFGLAGTKNLLMSLWQVDDAATKLFMTTLYEKIASGESIENALRESQQRVRSDYSHPKYWAPFVLVQF